VCVCPFTTENMEYKKLCTKDLEKADIDKWADAVQRDFFVSTPMTHQPTTCTVHSCTPPTHTRTHTHTHSHKPSQPRCL